MTPEKGKGTDNKAIGIKKLGLSAIPLRFVSLLLEDPIRIAEGGIKITVPNPSNYCLHKMVIANRRRSEDKKLKDLEQAICTYEISDLKYMKKQFNKFPKKWKEAVFQVLETNKEKLPLFYEKIEEIIFTLQK